MGRTPGVRFHVGPGMGSLAPVVLPAVRKPRVGWPSRNRIELCARHLTDTSASDWRQSVAALKLRSSISVRILYGAAVREWGASTDSSDNYVSPLLLR